MGTCACSSKKNSSDADGVIAYGVVIRGETTHYELISESTAQGLMQVSVIAKKPIGFGLIAAENLTQAKERTDPSEIKQRQRSCSIAC